MNKKILVVILFTFLLLGCIVGCSKEPEQSLSEYPVSDNLITVIKEGTLTSDDMYFCIQNTSDTYIYEFDAYCGIIEKSVDGHWQEVDVVTNELLDFDALWTVMPNDTIEHHLYWADKYGSLPSGNYRLTKMVTQITEDGAKENYCFRIEFSL